MKRLVLCAASALALVLSTARCTQLLGVDDASPYAPDASATALPKCPDGRASCKGAVCDTDIVNDPDNCGGCGVRCATVNGSATCAAGACTVACAQDFAECDQNLQNGCETNTSTDSHNCGACGRDCFGTPCTGGQCLPFVFATTRDPTSWLEVDDLNAYAASPLRIEVLPLDGSPKTPLLEGQGTIQQLKYMSGALYVVRQSAFGGATVNQLDWVSRNGQSSRCVARFPVSTSRRLDGDPTALAWGHAVADLDAGSPLVRTAEPDASCPADAGASAIANLAVVKDGRLGEAVVLDGPNAFITANDPPPQPTGIVGRVDRATGALTVLTAIRPLRNLARSIAVDFDHVYWVDNNLFVRRMPKTGCEGNAACIQDVYADELGRIWSINVDDKNVYVLASDGTVSYLEIVDRADFTKKRRFTADSNSSGDVTYNDKFVVWAVGQKVYRLSR